MISKKTTQISIGIFKYKTGEVLSKQTNMQKAQKRRIIELLYQKYTVEVEESK
jgi:hypothetical protein